MEKENFVFMKETRERIFNILGKISFPEESKKELLGIIGTLYGRNKNYQFFIDLSNCVEKQKEMVFSNSKHKMRQDFKVGYHRLLVNYIKHSRNETLKKYFCEIENASMQRYTYNFNLNRFEALRPLERIIEQSMRPKSEQDSLDAIELTPEDCRQVLTIWLIYPRLIFHPEIVEEILTFFEAGKLQISHI